MTPILVKIPNIKAILFDIYGTLFVSGSGDVGVSNNEAQSEFFLQAMMAGGCEPTGANVGRIAMDAFFSEIARSHTEAREKGIDVPEVNICDIWQSVLRKLASTSHITCSPSIELATRMAAEYESRANPTSPMPHCESVIGQLTENDLALGIVSNAQVFTPLLFRAYLGRDVAELGFAEDLCVYSYAAGVAKPSLRIFGQVLRNLKDAYNISPRESIYVGNDMLNDVWTANQVGCRTCLFAGDARSLRLRRDDPRCRDLTPDCVITSLPELMEIL